MILHILCVLCFIYFFNYLTLAFFCALKRKRKKREIVIIDVQEESDSDDNKLNKKDKLIKFILNMIYGWIRYRIIRLGKIPCHLYRNFVLRYVYKMDIGKNVVIYGGFEIREPWNIHIGEGSIIGDNSILDGRNGIVIGSNVNLSTGVWIWTEQHDINDVFFESNNKGGMVVIEDRAWISSRVSILPNVVIKEGAVVAAGAVVSKTCEAFSVNGGVPAKSIGERNNNLKYVFKGDHLPFY